MIHILLYEFIAKHNGHQNFTLSLRIRTPFPLILEIFLKKQNIFFDCFPYPNKKNLDFEVDQFKSVDVCHRECHQ